MVGYNQNQPNVWGSFAGGLEIGGALRRRQQQDAYGQAYQQNGFEGVRDAAGGFGDLETAQSAQGTMDEQEETALARATRSAQIAQRLWHSLTPLDEATRRERLTQLTPQLEPYGFDAQTIANVDTSEAGWAALGQSLNAAVGQFQEFQSIATMPDGSIVGIRPDRTEVTLREPTWRTDGTVPYRVNNGAVEYGQGEIPVRPSAAIQNPVRPLTPEDVQTWNIDNPAGWSIRDGEAPQRIGGAAGARGNPLERAQATADVDRLEALNAQADTDMATVAELDRFAALNAQTDTNPTNLQAFGIGGWRPFADDETQQMVQIISRLTPQQRVPGSGATSDFDARMFQDALPSVTRSREANLAIIGAYRVRGQLSRERAEFAADWLDEEGNLRQFDAEWRRYVNANPIFDRQSTPDNPILNTRRVDFATWRAQQQRLTGSAPAPSGATPSGSGNIPIIELD